VVDQKELNRRIRRTAFLTVGLAAALVFGIIVLVTGDWIPGTIIVVASVVGLAEQVAVIRRLCRRETSAPRHTAAH
jgi:hypothetical protein